jgi:hypothetical protein
MKYWIGVVSKDHVLNGVEHGIMQIGHGKKAPLQRLHKGDWLIYYSPVMTFGDKEPLQAFTALGQVADDEIYQYKMTDDFAPFRRKVTYQPTNDAPIRPLIEKLSFTTSKQSWGYVFRFGLVEIPKSDFEIIKTEMFTNVATDS